MEKSFTSTVQDIGKLVETVNLQGQTLKDQQDCIQSMAQRIEQLEHKVAELESNRVVR